MSESECKTANSTAAHARRSWAAGGSFWASTTEDSSTRRYASDVLDHAFNAESDFAFGVTGRERGGAPLQSNPRPVFTLDVSSPSPAYKEKASDNFLRRRAIFLRAVKQVQKKAYGVFTRLKTWDIETRKQQNEGAKPSVCSRHNYQAPSLQGATYVAPEGPAAHVRYILSIRGPRVILASQCLGNKGAGPRLQPLQNPATCDAHPQQDDTRMEYPCGTTVHPYVTISSISNEQSGRPSPNRLQHDLMLTPLQNAGGKNQRTLHRETFEVKNGQRRSLISRIRFQRERRR
ncbi:hypothetical protein P691DRAFT_554592 [Macrolepiota fuliginosa MF-IS2]|uniref:Uncharacterized protein n=1 Tax=Macrolepiota fuliginosa MF-IS2 TaxID=1400762 RepID=A0A9P5XR22_9AGAR|nr:hypothetical protein P691DRAFT_554592 [Macrolepiota fuliginosa MF-IS2]